MLKRIHHNGFIVENLEESIKKFSLLGFDVEKRFENQKEKAKASFLKLDNTSIEIWEFEDENTEFAKIIKNHTAFESNDVESDLQIFLNNGYSIAIPLTEGITVKKYAYLKDSKENYIEILETK